MKLGKATAEDFKIMWRVYKALNRMEHSYLLNDSQTRDNRCKALIVALLQVLGTGFMRITMGAETLIENCCDPDKSYLDFKPEITAAENDKSRLDFMLESDSFIVWELFDKTFKRCYLMTQDEDEEYHRISGEGKSFDTPRQAIDAAMKAKP